MFRFEPRDLWIGVYWTRRIVARRIAFDIYVCVIPCLVFKFRIRTRWEAKIRPAFMTGSRAYGTPRPDSDVDIVMHVDDEQLETLQGLFECRRISATRHIARHDSINLILCHRPEDVERWHEVTERLRGRRPVTRDEAIEEFNEAGLTGQRYDE